MTQREELKALSVKYGIALILTFLNRTIVAVFFSIFFSALVPDAGDIAGNDASYAAAMIINELAAYFVPLAAFSLIFADELRERYSPYERIRGENVLMFAGSVTVSAAGSLIALMIMAIVSALTGAQMPNIAFSSMMPQNGFQYTVFMLCVMIVSPVCEELIFRRALLLPLRRYGDLTAAFVTALIFGIFHFNLTQLAYTMLFGFFLSVLAIRSGSIIPCIVIHILNNLIVGISQYLPESAGNDAADNVLETIRAICGLTETFIEVFGVIALIILIAKRVFSLNNYSSLSTGQQLLCIISTPAVIAGSVLTALCFFI